MGDAGTGLEVYSYPMKAVNRPGSLWRFADSTIRAHADRVSRMSSSPSLRPRV